MRLHLFSLLLFLASVLSVSAQEITAVVPSTAPPGANITLSGGPFVAGDTVLIGDRRVAVAITPTRLTFTLPELPAGEYALAVERAGDRTVPTFRLRVIQPLPFIATISPATLDSCTAASERQVTVNGNHFLPGANLLLDNSSIPIDKLTLSEIVFTLPALKPGLHQVQVVNLNDQHSLPHGLFISSTPEVTSVQTGEDRVLDYELILQGKNFFFNSVLTVNGVAVGKTLADNLAPDRSVRESMRYVDCNTLIYIRRPFLRQPNELSLQIVNPGGEQSNVYQLTTP